MEAAERFRSGLVDLWTLGDSRLNLSGVVVMGFYQTRHSIRDACTGYRQDDVRDDVCRSLKGCRPLGGVSCLGGNEYGELEHD